MKKFASLVSIYSFKAKLQYPVILLCLLFAFTLILKTTTNVFAVDDTEPPTTPAILLISGTTPNSVTLTWTASRDNVGVEGYRIYRNGLAAIDVGLTLHTFYNLPAGSQVFHVRAFDVAENLSNSSNSVIYLSLGVTGPTPTNTPSPTVTPTMTPTNTPTLTPTPTLTVVHFNPVKDVYIRKGSANDNEGASQELIVQSTGKNRSILDFGTAPFINLQVGPSEIESAVLRLTITENGNNWGTVGRQIDIHRVVHNWAEGNGAGGNKGTGTGATWNCAIDSDIANNKANCSGVTDWDMDNPAAIWSSNPTDSVTIINNQAGIVEFDVTDDVRAILQGTTYYGWIIKLNNESQNGRIHFGSNEHTDRPEVVVTYTN